MNITGTECDRARESVSADLDRELHELDLHRLRAHLRVCPDCAAWAERFTATTAQLRGAPLEPPPAIVFESAPRSRVRRVRPALLAAPAAALVAGVIVSFGVVHHGLFGKQGTTSTALGPAGPQLFHYQPGIDDSRLPALHRVFRAI